METSGEALLPNWGLAQERTYEIIKARADGASPEQLEVVRQLVDRINRWVGSDELSFTNQEGQVETADINFMQGIFNVFSDCKLSSALDSRYIGNEVKYLLKTIKRNDQLPKVDNKASNLGAIINTKLSPTLPEIEDDQSETGWMSKAVCRGMEVSIFFPEDGGGVTRAKQICKDCPVAKKCLEYALVHRIDAGIWGGTSERERRRIRKRRKWQ